MQSFLLESVNVVTAHWQRSAETGPGNQLLAEWGTLLVNHIITT